MEIDYKLDKSPYFVTIVYLFIFKLITLEDYEEQKKYYSLQISIGLLEFKRFLHSGFKFQFLLKVIANL